MCNVYAPAVNIPAVAAATAAAGVAAVTARLRSTGASSIGPLHSSLGGLYNCTLAHRLLDCLGLWPRTSNGRKAGAGWPAVSGVAAPTSSTAVAASALSAAIATGTDCTAGKTRG